VYKLRNKRNSRERAAPHPIVEILMSEWDENGLKEPGALRSHLDAKLGPGRYQVVCCDPHGAPVSKIPMWIEDTIFEGNTDMSHPDDLDRPRRGMRRGARRGRDDFEDDDLDDFDDFDDYEPRGRGRGRGAAPIMDFIESSRGVDAQQQIAIQAQAKESQRSHESMMTTLLMTTQQQREADERRRSEERASEDRRREERRQDEVRQEVQRREEARQAEERRRDEDRRAEERRREERKEEQAAEARRSTERMQMITGLIGAAVPVLANIMAPKKDDTMAIVLAKAMEPKPTDPMMLTMISKMMESANSKSSLDQMLTGMAKVQEMSTTLQAESMRGLMNQSSELNGMMMKKALEMASKVANNGEANNGVFDKIVSILGSAAQLSSAQTAQSASAIIPAAQPQSLPAPQPSPAPAQPEQPPAQPQAPKGYDAVAKCLIALHTKAYSSPQEHQQIMDYMISEMPPELKAAIAGADQAKIMELCTPTFTGNPEYIQWLSKEGAIEFINATAAQLGPVFARPAVSPASTSEQDAQV
jgi:VIT1/CCC1 family predicted Fe2+/Mn2+ transporter